jgi:type I restriction enzyme S subunit
MSVATVPLGELCDILSGFAWSASKFNHDGRGVPIIRIQNVDAVSDNNFVFWDESYDERFVIRKGDVLLTLSGSFRIEAWTGPDALLNQRIIKLTPSPKLDRGWLLHVLRSRLDQIERLGKHALVNNVSLGDIRNLAIPLPRLEEQRRIAEVLDRAEALRAKRRAALAQLDTLTQTIFLDLFGDPITNKKGFTRSQLASLIRSGDTINYGVVQPGDDMDGGVPLIRVGDLQDGKVSHTALKRIAPKIEAAYKRSRLRGDEILVSCVGTVGIIVLADESVKGFNIARAVARIPLAGTTDRTFMAAYLKTDFVQRYFINELRTVSQPTLNIKQLSETTVMLPPIDLQREFARRVAAVEKLKEAHRASLGEMDALFASLQHRAFRGEL